MTQVITNDVSAVTPELWSSMVQIPLYKSLVALEVANMRLSDTVKNADTIHVPRFGDLSAKTYTPGTTITATAQDWHHDTLVVSTYKHVTFYVDEVHILQTNVNAAIELATEAGYRLKDAIDQHVFKNITGTDGFFTVDEKDLGLGATNGKPVSATSSNIINVFAGARKFLRERNVEEREWCAVVSPKLAATIEIKAATAGFNVADSTLRNGYAGDFMGFQVYISNNLPAGNLSAISPAAGSTVSIAAGMGGPSGANASGTTPGRAVYMGRKGTIDVVLQRAPALEIRKKDDMLGANFITWTVYGSALFNKNAQRGINLSMPTAFV
jgi:hypothetical protein